MSLALDDPALNASRRPSADQAGCDTAGSSSVSRRTSEPSGSMRKSASTPSRSETKAISPAWLPDGGGAVGCREEGSGSGDVVVHPRAVHTTSPAHSAVLRSLGPCTVRTLPSLGGSRRPAKGPHPTVSQPLRRGRLRWRGFSAPDGTDPDRASAGRGLCPLSQHRARPKGFEPLTF